MGTARTVRRIATGALLAAGAAALVGGYVLRRPVPRAKGKVSLRRLREGEYWRFCLEHVRQYNHSYNYFAGMSDEAVARFQKDAITGHRPTWKLGQSGGRWR